MTPVLPELRKLPPGLLLDGEIVTFNGRQEPYFPKLCRRVLMGDRTIPVRFLAFDLLRENGEDLAGEPLRLRRTRLEELEFEGSHWSTPETFAAGRRSTRPCASSDSKG